jgi:hypothetical protein
MKRREKTTRATISYARLQTASDHRRCAGVASNGRRLNEL